MNWRERIFGNRDKIKNVGKAEEKVEQAIGTLWDTLRDDQLPVSKNCLVCNSPNPAEARVCWKCQNIF